MSCLISIVVPFYNSHHKSRDLVATLSSLSGDDIEIIFVDDGSTQDQFRLLVEDAARLQCRYQLLRQSNKGPGGARNAGLKLAAGDYVWFVDSDDDIRAEAIDQVRRLSDAGYDFIDFQIVRKGQTTSSMSLDDGGYLVTDDVRLHLLSTLGRLCTKVFRRSWLADNGIAYPEHCIYEDNYLLFVIPFAASRFYCSDEVAYIHNVGAASVTRTPGKGLDSRYFDRLITAERGLRFALSKCEDATQRKLVATKFRNLFLMITGERLWRSGDGDLIKTLLSAYLHVVAGTLSEDERRDELAGAHSVFVKRAMDEEQRHIRESLWESAAPSADSFDYFTSLRDVVWRTPASFPS